MGFRRRARELAMQALYYIDIRGGDSNEKVILFRKLHSPPQKSKTFFHDLVSGVRRNRQALVAIIEDYSSNWKISRMPCVDRNILRIAVYEMLVMDDIPVKVSINEAIDIGKKYGTEDSGAFINGILDGIHQAWDQGQINFEPFAAFEENDPAEAATNTKNGDRGTINQALKATMKPGRVSPRSIRVAPGLRKRIAARPKES